MIIHVMVQYVFAALKMEKGDLKLHLPYFIGYKPSDFYTSLVRIVLKSKGKRATRLTQTEKYIDFKRKITTQVFAYKSSKTQSHK